MEPRTVTLEGCSLGLGELHRLEDHGFFHPRFDCVTPEGGRFTARMRLHVTEPLDPLAILDPRLFPDGGMAANSAGSDLLRRNSSWAPAGARGGSPLLRPDAVPEGGLFRLPASEIRKALLRGYVHAGRPPGAAEMRGGVAFTCHDPNLIGGGNIILFRFVNWLADLGVPSTIYSCGSPPTWTRVRAKFRCFASYSEMFPAIREDIVVLFSMWHIEPMLAAAGPGRSIWHLRQIVESFHYGVDHASMLAPKPVIELLEGLPIGSIAISPHIEAWYRERLGVRSLLVTNGIDVSNFRPGKEPKDSSGGVRRVVSVGSPSHFVKGGATLADALNRLASRRPDLKIRWTVACGYEKHGLSGNGRNLEVEYRHGLSPAGMRDLYRGADVVANPSLYEGFGLPTLEAMACGAPVVHADNRGLDGIVSDGRDCLVVPVADAGATAAAVERLLDDAALSARIAAGGIETARRHTTREQFAMFLDAFGEILGRPFPEEAVERVRGTLPRADGGTEVDPLVSVVIPAYNQAEYLREALDSLLAQTYANWEAVVVNDGSKDHTVEVMEEYAARDPRIRPFSKENGGISSALNEGIRHARGEFFCWLSSDDLFYPGKIAAQVEAFRALPDDFALVYGSFDLLEHETGRIDVQPFAEPLAHGAEFPEALKFDFIDGCTIMIRMRVLREVGGFHHDVRHSQDMELWMRLASRGYRFHLLPEKLTIRRIHLAQSSTGNMIHCRYDAAWMVNHYLRRYHLLEVYRYFELASSEGKARFVDHLVGRTLHTEANVNHPLLMDRFWRWVDEGLEFLPVGEQIEILRLCLESFLSRRGDTKKVEYYLAACAKSMGRERVCRRSEIALDLTVGGRDFRIAPRSADPFAGELFDYGTDLFVNGGTPLFAQELYFHNTHKVVDTPYKLGHSVIRYLSQFDNPFRARSKAVADPAMIPESREAAVRLYARLRHPETEGAMSRLLDLLAGSPIGDGEPDRIESEIAAMPAEQAEDLARACGRGATEPSPIYWHALVLDGRGDVEGALDAGWSALVRCSGPGRWVVARRVAEWALAAGDTGKAVAACLMGMGENPWSGQAEEALRTLLPAWVEAERPLPEPKPFPDASAVGRAARVADCRVLPKLDGTSRISLVCADDSGKPFRFDALLAHGDGLEKIEVRDPSGAPAGRVRPADVIRLWTNGYDFLHETMVGLASHPGDAARPSVAFTIRESSILGGGPSIVFRYANWLAALGVDVAVYSDDAPPAWVRLGNLRFHTIPAPRERYAAIREQVVVAYSVLELPDLLAHADLSGKRVFHICQGVEDFNYHGPSYESLVERKPLFEMLHSLPVGRIAVSPHVAEHFEREYGQKCHTIVNGIDLRRFRPIRKPDRKDRLDVMIVGSPARLLKGASDVRQALTILKKQEPGWEIALTIVSGQRVPPDSQPDTSALGFRTEILWGLSSDEMREAYARADVFVNPAWYEGFGLPTLEAMACRVPVVQADNRGLDGIVRDGVDCLVVPPQSPGSMAAAIRRLRKEPSLRERLLEEGLRTAARHSLGRQFDEFVRAFEAILFRRFDGRKVRELAESLAEGTTDERVVAARDSRLPLISVLVPTYNHAKYLPAALDSLLVQNYARWEAIVVNDGSTDETPFVLDCYASVDPRIRIFHKENGGVSTALNEGLRHARGSWICWLPSDDLFAAGKLAELVHFINSDPEARFFHTHYALLEDETGRITAPWPGRRFEMPPESARVTRFLLANYVHGSSVAIHRSVFDAVGFFDESLRSGQDFDMWLRISRMFPLRYLDSRTVITRIHAGQGTAIDPLSGFTDSARSAAAFLARHPFPELFPALDLDKEEDALVAAGEALRVAADPQAFLYREGPTTALFDRLREWLSANAGAPWRPAMAEVLERVARAAEGAPLPPWMLAAFRSLPGAFDEPFVPGAAPSARRKAVPGAARPGVGFRVVAIVAAHNEEDVIDHAIADLVGQGIEVYLIDNASTDDTVRIASKWLGKGLLHIERFPEDAGYPEVNRDRFYLHQIMRRKEEIAASIDADWFINHDADEFREAVWPGLSLKEGIRLADRMGYNAIDFAVLNFRPVDDRFVPGTDVREALTFFEPGESFDARQVRAWKNLGVPVELASNAGHDTQFPGRRVLPVKFLLRHYPIRSQAHGEKKVLKERKDRFGQEERAVGWHVQYDGVAGDGHRFLHRPETLERYDGNAVRARLLSAEALAAVERAPSGAAERGGAVPSVPEGSERPLEAGARMKREGKYREAEEAFRRAVEEGEARALPELADCLAQTGRFEEARACYRLALEADARDARALGGLGVLHLASCDAAGAEGRFAEALEADPGDARALCGMGISRRMQGDAHGAFDWLVRALEADPSGLTAIHELTKAAFETGRYGEAEARLRRYLEFDPSNGHLIFSLAGICWKQGKREAALDALDRLDLFLPGYEGAAELRDAVSG